ncbi:hypothetical protein WR25_08670 isoform B [Diploscapter pachys]|uniref:Helicase ATP-binding domain-containing protein n=1 Tax=Diploscapter pachys TaxID=2018661 RepID=A0A2A2K2J2_9BILA|nr:hypothetical protein WR25_08670 isoform A [Diploscapter pachys]PAV68155.1 hypothetical protein WR25_08670 isoform B [Diploscapter pachys]
MKLKKKYRIFPDYAQAYHNAGMWNLREIDDDVIRYNKSEVASAVVEDHWQRRRALKQKQALSKWYELFANALEGKNSNLLVDFSRVPKGFARSEEEETAEANKKSGKGWAGQKQGGGGGGGKKGGKEPPKSKKDLIVEANKKAKDAKLQEDEDKKLKFAAAQGKLAVSSLTRLYPTLELDKTKASCCYEITIREYREIMDQYGGRSNQSRRKIEAVQLVGHIKDCFVKHWKHLDDKQKEQIVDFWVSLGFDAPAGAKSSAEAANKKLDLGMHMVYYQLEYGGQLIDIHSDPQKDDRVSGFAPDAWQRKMLDSVDRTNSALIVAPTSAGKTFVSYYCIEKVLRNSDDDVVVYVSPSKALLNQVCGSIYARFRNKTVQTGKHLFGTLTTEFGNNALTCQVLVTIPESLEALMMSTSREVQQFVKNIKYVIFDEVHCIGASEEAHIWEHLLLLIRCPFLALSATIGNANKLHEWLNAMEGAKSGGRRKVDLIMYSERYSELELALVSMDKPQGIEGGMQELTFDDEKEENADEKQSALVVPMMPYGVYMPEKLRMFGIPADQQLTARQILSLYNIMASVDDVTKKQYEPAKFFGQKGKESVWISRSMLRELENKLKERFLQWLESDEEKMKKVLTLMADPIKTQMEYRTLPFNKTHSLNNPNKI